MLYIKCRNKPNYGNFIRVYSKVIFYLNKYVLNEFHLSGQCHPYQTLESYASNHLDSRVFSSKTCSIQYTRLGRGDEMAGDVSISLPALDWLTWRIVTKHHSSTIPPTGATIPHCGIVISLDLKKYFNYFSCYKLYLFCCIGQFCIGRYVQYHIIRAII